MKIRVAKFLLFIFLAQSTQFGEVLKAPLLVAHFIQHKHLYPETTVYGFIKMHYFDKTVIDADYAQDMQLPFKTINAHFFSMQLSLPPLLIQLERSPDYIIQDKLPVPVLGAPSAFSTDVFQPPKPA
jgi:hypothetical protein